MRIAIDGAQSTGKTTLLCQLSKTHLNLRYSFIEEASRHVAANFGIVTAADWQKLLGDKDRLRHFFDAEESWQLAHEKMGTSWIIDSSFFLTAAYRKFFGIEINLPLLSSRSYDLILYCPVESCNMVENGFRFSVGRAEVDRIYREIISCYYFGKILELPGGTMRLALAVSAIDSLVI